MACPACGYNLRMLSKPVCPECGLPLKLTVGSDEPYKRAWAIALTANAMVAGIGAIFLLIALGGGYPPEPGEDLAFIWFYGPMLWIPAPVILLRLRKKFCGINPRAQNVVAGLSILWFVLIGLLLLAGIG